MNQPVARPVARQYVGSAHTLSERVRVYWTERALEVDRLESYEIRRSRVFFDEVQLVTLHSRLGGSLPWLPLFLAALVGFSAAVTRSEALEASRMLTWVALGFFLLGAVFFFIPLWVVTVFGRRTRARMQFRLRERKARDVFARICQASAEAQRTLPVPAQEPQPLPLPLSSSEPPIAPD